MDKKQLILNKILNEIKDNKTAYKEPHYSYKFNDFILKSNYLHFVDQTGCYTVLVDGQEIAYFGKNDGAELIWNELTNNERMLKNETINNFLKKC